MRSKYEIRYIPIAVEDLLSIYDWIADDSPNRAAAFVEKIDKKILNLENHPQLGRMPRNEKLKLFGYRVLIIDSFLIFYKVHSQVIEIHRVVHGSRNLDDLI